MRETLRDQREFARIDARVRVRVQPLDDERAASLRAEILARPTVWAPSSEAALRDLAVGGTGHESILAQAVLDLTVQIVRLRARLAEHGPVKEGTVVQLSGGGGRLVGVSGLDSGDRLEVLFVDDVEDAPPIRTLARVVHRAAEGDGFRFDAIHPQDREALVRFIYRLQRRALRESHERD